MKHAHRNLIKSTWNQIIFTGFRLIWIQINRNPVNTIWFQVDLTRFWKDFSVRRHRICCIVTPNRYCLRDSKTRRKYFSRLVEPNQIWIVIKLIPIEFAPNLSEKWNYNLKNWFDFTRFRFELNNNFRVFKLNGIRYWGQFSFCFGTKRNPFGPKKKMRSISCEATEIFFAILLHWNRKETQIQYPRVVFNWRQ